MPLLYLVRHGENDMIKQERIAGRMRGVHLNEKGKEQAHALARAFSHQPITAIYSSPLERAMETILPAANQLGLEIQARDELLEMDYGAWQGAWIPEVKKTPLWKTVQRTPSRAEFPQGEIFSEAQVRISRFLHTLWADGGAKERMICVSHGDMIKLAVSALIGLPLDLFQRLRIDPASITVISLEKERAVLVGLNWPPDLCVLP